MEKQYILTILSRFRGRNHKEHRLFIGTSDQAREAATDIRRQALNDGHSDVRVEIWKVIATNYQGTVRR